jgi:glycosyltransferase involved in cell wall biosynthesis
MIQYSNKRILFISHYFPYDLSTMVHGTYKRIDTLIDAIKQVASIDMLFYVRQDRNINQNDIPELEKTLSNHWNTNITLHVCPRSETNTNNYLSLILATGAGIPSFLNQKGYKEFSGTKQLKALEECLQRSPDAIFAHRLEAMCPLLRISKRPLPPIIFDLDDIEHVVLERYIKNRNNLRSNLLKLLLPSLTKGEYEAVKLASKTFVCSENDRKYLAEKFKLPGVTVIPNSISVPKLEPLTEEPNLLYLSSDYGPNIQAAEYLVDEIWPKIRYEIPEAKLILAGVSAEKFNFREENVPGLEMPGFVEDLDALYRKVRATAVSLLVGSGTRFKIIEAAMYGKPTVSTRIGAEGIELADTSEILIEDTPESFSDACIKLLSDRDLSKEIGLAARKKAKEFYDRQNVVDTIKKLILEAVK